MLSAAFPFLAIGRRDYRLVMVSSRPRPPDTVLATPVGALIAEELRPMTNVPVTAIPAHPAWCGRQECTVTPDHPGRHAQLSVGADPAG
jgi:hypothetical protein